MLDLKSSLYQLSFQPLQENLSCGLPPLLGQYIVLSKTLICIFNIENVLWVKSYISYQAKGSVATCDLAFCLKGQKYQKTSVALKVQFIPRCSSFPPATSGSPSHHCAALHSHHSNPESKNLMRAQASNEKSPCATQ
jgi:hypothetical protein